MTDTQIRFLKAIAERLPAERVAEVHLFPPLRQGGAETGVAVIAVEPLPAVEPAVADEAMVPEGEIVEGEAEVDSDDAVAEVEVAESMEESAENEESPYAPEPVAAVAADDAAADEALLDEPALSEAPAEPIVRHVVYSARYRYTLKGPERGKWEADVVAEADAPLITVERVVRGVRDRAGEAAEPERLTAAQFHALVAGEAPWAIGRSA